MLYFAYGSNLDSEQMRSRCPGCHDVGLAALRDHRLSFPRHSDDWDGGVGSPALAHGHDLWGYLYDITDQDKAELDRYEGWIAPDDPANAYQPETITVDLVRPDDDSPPRRVRALTYIARATEPKLPSRRYLDVILKGARARAVPEEYLAELNVLPVADPEVPTP
jgi:hypothetical protein